jgi:hypothetical protein
MIAALLTRMSMPPNASTAAPAIACADARSLTSTATPVAPKPSAVSVSAALVAAPSSTSASTTEAPASPSACPYAMPMLPAPPVMIATLPCRSKSSLAFIARGPFGRP